ncbi:MAG: phosphoribosylformylglycinamidine synthase I, partial [Chloroflexi bacterium]|nr:phosphoribosylformylglycinamidine synthase I [Chloroflexota bacterium]
AVGAAEWPALQAICASQNVEAVSIGTFEASGRLRLHYGATLVADLSKNFLHEGIPQRLMDADLMSAKGSKGPSPFRPKKPKKWAAREESNFTPALLALLAHPNIRSKEAIVRRYDHEVQGGTAVKPFVGVANHGPSDAAVIVPLTYPAQKAPASDGAVRGAALSAGICPRYGELDPYAMAWAAIDEAMRNAVCVGADPDQVALLDNFCWGKPTLPDRLGSLVQAAHGCYDAAVAYGAPFISGKDSLNNEYLGADGRPHAIPGTLLISALGIVPDVNRTATMDLKQAGNLLYLVGDTNAELGGSHYQEVATANVDAATAIAPQPVANPLRRLRAIHQAIRQQLVQSCHDCSEGGLGVALAEMCLAGRLGAIVDLDAVPGEPLADDGILFAESAGRFVIEVWPTDAPEFEALFADVPLARIGVVGNAGPVPTLQVLGVNGQTVIQADVSTLEQAWRGSLAPTVQHASVAASKTPAPRPASRPLATAKPRVLIMHANGTNRDRDAALACELAGATPEIVHINQLLAGERQLLDYQMVVLPGGFSYGDDLGAGVLWALDLHQRLGDDLTQFAATGRPMLGICNGFQALVKAGLLPGGQFQAASARTTTLTNNAAGHFECRWVYLRPNPASPCLFTQGLDQLIYCPVAHGEGRFIADPATLAAGDKIALTYVDAAGGSAVYPLNPNGSVLNVAGICNQAGNILGLMPHPEDHIFGWQHPRSHRRPTTGEPGFSGLRLFEQGVRQC